MIESHEDQLDSLLRHQDPKRDAQLGGDSQLPRSRVDSCRPSFRFLLIVLVALSAAMNLATVLRYFTERNTPPWMIPSLYTGIRHDNPTVFDWKTDYGPHATNQTRQDELWESIRISPGVVAVTDDWVRERGLKNATRFPWDPSSLSIYLLAGYHKIHCLNILCEADDTPLYNTRMGGKQAGPDEVRHCRSWDEMEAWAVRNTGCFGYVNETGDESGGLDYYKYCPEGSRFLPAVRDHFGLPDDWVEVPVEQVPPY